MSSGPLQQAPPLIPAAEGTPPLGTPDKGHASERIQRLLRDLVREAEQLATTTSGAVRDACGREVILDIGVDGLRYVLARSPLPRARTQTLLSSRELEIARMIAAGHTNKTIARVLDISAWTVSTHLRRIFAKLDVGSRAAMVARLLEDGMLGERLDVVEKPFGHLDGR
jgi:DNA-binding CsgD family transcriptional regulator